MKIVRIIGGLGNQMFQYAFLISLREKYKQKIYADISSFNGYNLHNGLELEKVFNIKLFIANPFDIKKLSYATNSYIKQRLCRHLLPKKKTECIESSKGDFINSVFTNSGDCYYEGYWQNYKYFHDYYNIISNEFTFRFDSLIFENNELLKIVNLYRVYSVSIHIRRGDYLNSKRFKNICNIDYYNNAIKKALAICPNAYFFIFSNDTDWCKKNVTNMITQNKLLFIDWNNNENSYIDMYIMTLCRINIIANSSFSWWAAYLNKNDDKIIIAPEKWTNDYISFKRQLPDWILI